MAGLTETGFTRKLLVEIAAEILAEERDTISAELDGSESTVIGNVNTIFADQSSETWEVLEEVVNAFDPDNATGARLRALCLLTGIKQRGATPGLVTATVNLDVGTYLAGSLIAAVLDQPTNLWTNRDNVVSTGTADYPAVFLSTASGSGASAVSGTLSVIAGPVTGWNSITNAADATPGQDIENEDSLRIRREASLSAAGSGTVDAIKASVQEVTGVIDVSVLENVTDVPVAGIPARGHHVIVWDGDPAAADDNDIAQAIYDSASTGSVGVGATTGTATKADGTTKVVPFTRVTVVDIYVDVDVESVKGVSIAAVKAAVLAAVPSRVGASVIFNKIAAAVFAVPGVDDWNFVEIGLAPSPSGTVDISLTSTQIARLDSSDIVVTGDAS